MSKCFNRYHELCSLFYFNDTININAYLILIRMLEHMPDGCYKTLFKILCEKFTRKEDLPSEGCSHDVP